MTSSGRHPVLLQYAQPISPEESLESYYDRRLLMNIHRATGMPLHESPLGTERDSTLHTDVRRETTDDS